MAEKTHAFIDDILWASPALRIGDTQWRAIVYLLPERYGKNLTRFGYQFRQSSLFGSPAGAWRDAREHRSYREHKPMKGLPEQLRRLLDENKDEIDSHLGYGPDKQGQQLSLDLAA